MLRVNLFQLKPGMKLAQPVYNADGVLLLAQGTELSKQEIERLLSYGVRWVYIEGYDTPGELIVDIISQQTRTDAIRTLKNLIFAVAKKELVPGGYREILDKVVEKILGELRESRDKCVKMLDIRTLDSYTYALSVNVCLLSLLVGLAMNFTEEELKVLGLAALLHDIGKMMVPKEILEKEAPLDEEEREEVEQHPYFGYRLVLEDPQMNPVIAEIIYQHHERYDGSGYPRGLKGKEILLPASIVGIADVYDALTSNRPFRQPLLPHEAVEYLYASGNRFFPIEVVKIFLRHVAVYPLGTVVRLSNGEKGVVTAINPDLPAKPVVRIITDSRGKKPRATLVRDLARIPNVTITHVLEGSEERAVVRENKLDQLS
ncbi:MAG: hypothetical protein PWQ91_829 [Eubacteriales bacterium]|nr:hypothetical protein [Eubacteriales bacterium]